MRIIENVLITPELAKEYLTKNKGNRKVNDKHVLFLAQQMLLGIFKEETGEGIKISKTDRLLDGQHRLLAIIKTDKAYTFTVFEDLEDDIFDVLDTGRNRNAADVLSTTGLKNSTGISALVGYILDIKSKRMNSHRGFRIPNSIVLEFIINHPEVEEIYKYVEPLYRRIKYLSPGLLGAVYYILKEKGHTEAKIEEFFNAYSTGLNITNTHPIYHLRTKLIQDSINKSKLPFTKKYALFVNAWNLFITNKEVAFIRIPDSAPELI